MVGLGGFLGAVSRYLLGLIPIRDATPFPFITLLINFVGSFAIGVISQLAYNNNTESSAFTLFLKVGVCGGFTTFSTFALESGDMLRGGREWTAVVYMLASLVLCVSGALFGRLVVRRAA